MTKPTLFTGEARSVTLTLLIIKDPSSYQQSEAASAISASISCNEPTMISPSWMRLPSLISRPSTPPLFTHLAPWKRFARCQAFEASFDPADLAEARKWRQSITEESLPKGTTTFARSSGPGGQHVNKFVARLQLCLQRVPRC